MNDKRKKKGMSAGGQIAAGVALANPITANIAGSLPAIPAMLDIKQAPELESDGALQRFLEKQRLKGELPDGVTARRGAHDMDFQLDLAGEKPVVRAGRAHAPAIMHEIGHAQADNPLSALRHQNVRGAMDAAKAGNTPRAIGHWYGETLLAPWDEGVAWKNAMMMDAAEGRRMKMLKTAIPAYASYLARGGAVAGGLGLAGAGIYNAVRGDE